MLELERFSVSTPIIFGGFPLALPIVREITGAESSVNKHRPLEKSHTPFSAPCSSQCLKGV